MLFINYYYQEEGILFMHMNKKKNNDHNLLIRHLVYESGECILKSSNTFFLIILIIQPVIDILSSISTKYNYFPISIGALIKTTVMFGLIFYLARHFFLHNKLLLILFSSSYISVTLTILVNLILKENFVLFAELNFSLKTSYYLTMIYISIVFFQINKVTDEVIYQSTKLIGLIIGISYWVALITKTSFDSYHYGGAGYSGWFYSANELSVIVILLLGLITVNLSKDKSFTAWLAFILILSMVPMIGTKTAFLGGIIIIFFTTLYYVLQLKTGGERKITIALYISIIIIFSCLIPFTPIASKTMQSENISMLQQDKQTGSGGIQNHNLQKILSSRDIYYQQTKEDYLKAKTVRKLFGLGYSGDYRKDPELIEMDFFDLFFSYGAVGILFLIAPLIYVICYVLSFQFNHRYITLLMTLGLAFSIAFLAGHVVFAPAVMTYVALVLVALNRQMNRDEVYD